ncbi:MAG: hypothetical protein AAF492_03310 [Verrucomicrobiota bacterium]
MWQKPQRLSAPCFLLIESIVLVAMWFNILNDRRMPYDRLNAHARSPDRSWDIQLVPMDCVIERNGIVIKRKPGAFWYRPVGTIGDVLTKSSDASFEWDSQSQEFALTVFDNMTQRRETLLVYNLFEQKEIIPISIGVNPDEEATNDFFTKLAYQLKQLWTRHHRYQCRISTEPDVGHRLVRRVLDTCMIWGFGDLSFAVREEKAIDIISWEPTDRESTTLLMPTDVDLHLHMARTHFTVNGTRYPFEDMTRVLTPLAGADRISITSTWDAGHDPVVQSIDTLCVGGNKPTLYFGTIRHAHSEK